VRQALGEILLREKWVTPEQLDAALKAQVIFGGRLGTNLVEAGALTLDQLAKGLSVQHGIPAAVQKHFDQITPWATGLLSAKLAEKHGAIPLGLASKSPKTIAVAFMDPTQMAAVDEVSFALGARMMVTVAPELRVMHYLEKLYGIARKNRFLRINAEASTPTMKAGPTQAERRKYLEAPPSAAAAPAPAPASAFGAPPSGEEGWLGEDPAFMMASTGNVPRALHQPPAKAPTPVAPPAAQPPAATSRPALSAPEAVARIGQGTTRDEVGDAVVDYLRSAFGVGLVLLVRDDTALGWKGFAPGVDASLLETVSVPLGSPSMLQIAYERRNIFRGAPPADGAALQGRLFKLLKCAAPSEVVVAPVVIRERAVNLIYAHAVGGGPLPDTAMADLVTVAAAASTAFVRLIQKAKGKA
jgi:hypothetical protein